MRCFGGGRLAGHSREVPTVLFSAARSASRRLADGPRLDRAIPIDTTSTSPIRAAFELTKPGITAYVMITTGASALVTAGGEASAALVLNTMLGTGLSTAGALALNQYAERAFDAVMVRTRHRPLPSGRLTPGQALGIGIALLVVGLPYLAVASGWWPAAIAAVSALAYLGGYTPLKTRSYWATLMGAIPGAFPTLIGSTAAAGVVEPVGLSLFAIAYLWQLPHVLGLAWMLREDYAKVGFRLIPPGGGDVIGRHMVVATGLLLPVCTLPTVVGATGAFYAVGALLASGGFVSVAVVAARDLTDVKARKLFLASLLYHPVLLGLMLLDALGG